MSFLERLQNDRTVKLLAGLKISATKAADGSWHLEVEPIGEQKNYVLLGLQFCSHILARYPEKRATGYQPARLLQEMLNLIVNEGVWTGSDLLRYIGANERIQLVKLDKKVNTLHLCAALITSAVSNEPGLVFEEPVEIPDEVLIFFPVAVFQAILEHLDDAGIELLDRSLRYFYSYLGDGTPCSDLISATNLANRAWRAAVS
ncbi:MAG: hypothetical protein ACUVUR_02755 [bacterium]